MAQTLAMLVSVAIISFALMVRGISLVVTENEDKRKRLLGTLRGVTILFYIIFVVFSGVGLWMNDYIWLSAGIAAGSVAIGTAVQRQITLQEGKNLKELGKQLRGYSGFMFIGLCVALIIIIVKNV